MKTLIYSNLYIALCAAILTLGTYGFIKVSPDPNLILHVFGVTLMAYNMQRLVRLQKFTNRTDQIRWYLKNKWMLYTALIIGMMVSSWTFLQLPLKLLLAFTPLALISFSYSIPFLPSKDGPIAVRDIPGAKIFLIALVWTGVTWVLPIQEAGISWTAMHYLIALERFLFIVAITIPFDIRDLRYDSDSMRTIPQLLGYSKAKDLAIFLLIICGGIHAYVEFFLGSEKPIILKTIGTLFFILVAVLVSRMRADSSDTYFTGLLDGTMLILGLILMLI